MIKTRDGGIVGRDDQELVEELLSDFDTLLVTDCDELGNWIDPEGRTRVCLVDDPASEVTTRTEPLLVHAATAGKTIRTWCQATDGGRRLARETAKTLDPLLLQNGNGERVKHIVAAPPDEWVPQPELAEFKDLVAGARPTLPASPKPSTNGARPGGGSPAFDPASFGVTPLDLAERILLRPERASRCLLVIGEIGEFVALYTQDPDTDIWRDPEATLLGWQATIADDLQAEVYRLAADRQMDPKTTMSMVRSINAIKTPDTRSSVSRSFKAAVDRLRSRGIKPTIRECAPTDLNADMRYLGVRNGVVDLHEGKLVTDQAVAADAKITVSTPVAYDPEQYPAADWFLSHLPPHERDWWLNTLGYALRGIPKRLYGCLAAPDSGKTSAINMLRKTLGPYVDSPTPGTLDARAKLDGSTHTPGLFAWFAPVRLTIIDELKERELSAQLAKDLTGGGYVSGRDTYGKRVTRRATGTTYIFANDSAGEQALPQLRTDDPGIKARYRELPFPEIPKAGQNADVRDKWPLDPKRQAQLLTLLVQRAAANPKEPEDIPGVGTATRERIRKDSGELGTFARRMIRDGSNVLPFTDVWVEWCRHNSEPTDAPAPGGIRKRDFVRRLSAHVEELTKPTPMKVEGRNVRGWRGWRLLPAEEAERGVRPDASTADPYSKPIRLPEGLSKPRAAEEIISERVRAVPRGGPVVVPALHQLAGWIGHGVCQEARTQASDALSHVFGISSEWLCSSGSALVACIHTEAPPPDATVPGRPKQLMIEGIARQVTDDADGVSRPVLDENGNPRYFAKAIASVEVVDAVWRALPKGTPYPLDPIISDWCKRSPDAAVPEPEADA